MRRRSILAVALWAFGCGANSDKDGGGSSPGLKPGTDATVLEDGEAIVPEGGASFDVGPAPTDVVALPDAIVSGPPADCKGLQCAQAKCDPGVTTTVTGSVYAPNGTLPLYNVIVFVPNAELAPFPAGVLCDKCGVVSSGDPVVTALTNEKGQFTLMNVPSGKDIPFVMQLGKWRRKVTIPEVKPCVNTAFTDKNLTRLPKNQTEGDMPKVAVTTGAYDQVGCMLPKIGIDTSEFGVAGSASAVHFYSAGGASGPPGMSDAKVLWNSLDQLKKYDVAIFSCEGEENYKFATVAPTKDDASIKAVTDYLSAGGRIFTTDFQYVWYKYSPDPALKSSATIPGGAPLGVFTVNLDTSFPKGKALADWMKFVDPSVAYGTVPADTVFANYTAVDPTKVQTWGRSGTFFPPGGAPQPRFMTTNTPVGKPVEAQCGKAVHLDAHVNATDKVDATYPAGCVAKIKPAEEAFAFFFFDLSSCIQKEADPPKPPPPIK
ncbi:MAG: hypothetical protein ACXWUG_07290 [Polyangiales bacterium]